MTEQRQAEAVFRESRHFLRSILDALTTHIAVLDERGVIIAVNAAWRRFAEANEADWTCVGPGVNYLSVCDAAIENGREEATTMAAGIRAVINREQDTFSLEYPCHAPEEERWFRAYVSRFQGEGPVRVVVAHESSTDRKLAEMAVQREKEMARRYLDVAGVMIVALDLDETVTLINRSGCALLGYLEDEVVGKNWFDLFLPERERAGVRKVLEALVEGHDEAVEYFESPVVTKAGEERVLLWHHAVIRDEGGRIVATLGSGTDITEHKRAEEALKQSEARNRAMLAGIPDLIFGISREGVFIDFEAKETGALYVPFEEFIGRNIADVFPRNLAGRFRHAMDKVLQTREIERLEYSLKTLDAKEHDFEARVVPLEDGDVLAVVQDISERRRLEREILRISDEERSRIGRDLHDVLGSHLTGATMLAQSLALDAEEGKPVEADALKKIAWLVREGAHQARVLSRGLSPVKVEQQGLAAALQELAAAVQHGNDLACSFEGEETPLDLDKEVDAQLYRIAQEAVNNAVKHAQARHVWIHLALDEGALVLTVRDDGVGLPEEVPFTEGLGLSIMPYRAHLIGAVFNIDSAPGGGTVVTCSLPIKKEAPRNRTLNR